MAARPLPRAYSSRYGPPAQINTQSPNLSSPDHEDEDGDDNASLGSDGQSIIGVSLGLQQAHLASPTATGAERLAAYDNNPDADDIIGKAVYTDGQTEEPGEQSSDSEPNADTFGTAPLPVEKSATRKRGDTLPKPWRVNTNDAWVTEQRRDSRNASRVRPRSTSLMDNGKEAPGWKKFIPTLPKVSMPKIMVSKSSLSNQSSEFSKASESQPSLAKDTSATGSVSREEVDNIVTRDFQEPASATTGTYRSIVPPPTSSGGLTERPQLLRRTTSDGSLYLQRALSHASSLGDDERWADVHEQVNSRMKAIRDTLADSNLRLPRPSMPDISLPKMNSSWLDIDTTRFKSRTLLTKNDRSASPQSMPAKGKEADVSKETVKDAAREAKDAAVSPPPGMTKASAATHPHFTRALKKSKGDLVILGGYRGSVLRSAEPPHRQVWVPVKVGLNIRKVDLEVGLSHEDELNAEEKIIPSGMLKNIGPVDISRRLFKRLSTCKNAIDGSLRVWDYGYDWRLSPHLLSAQLIQFLETLECNSPNVAPEHRGATVIAHSLGGLVTRHAVNKRPELFSGVLYAGTPQNCVNILGPFRNGDDVLLSSKVLTAQVNFSMRSSFALLPLDGKCFFNAKTKERYDMDFFDPKNWDDWCLSPVISRPFPPPSVQQTSTGPIDGFVNSMSSVIPALKRRGSSPRPSATSSMNPTDTTGGGAHNRAVGPQMDNRGDAVTQHNENPETNISTAVDIPKPIAMEYLTRTLKEVKQFKEELRHDPEREARGLYPPCAVIYGKSVPTVYGARVDSREGIRHSSAYDNLAFASGDGVVLARAAQLPPGYKVSRGGCVSSERGHISLLGDLEAVGQCLNAIRVEKRLRNQGQSIAREPRVDEIERKVVA